MHLLNTNIYQLFNLQKKSISNQLQMKSNISTQPLQLTQEIPQLSTVYNHYSTIPPPCHAMMRFSCDEIIF